MSSSVYMRHVVGNDGDALTLQEQFLVRRQRLWEGQGY